MALTIDPATLSPSGWWKADAITGVDGSLVATWSDSSGNGRNLTQATDSLKPKLRLWQDANNPRPAGGTHKSVRFDGTDDYLQSAANLSAFLGTNGLGTMLAVVRCQKGVILSASGYGVMGVNAAAGTKLSLRLDYTPIAWEAQNNDGAADAVTIRSSDYVAAGNNAPFAGASSTGPVAPAAQIVVWRHDPTAGPGGLIQIAVNNLDDAAAISASSGATTDMANALLLGRTFEHYWYGDIFEVMTFPTILSQATLRGLCLWLTQKYGMAYESGIAAEPNPVVTTRIEMKLPSATLTLQPSLWLKAESITGLVNDDPVATWSDSSGNGYDATQGTAGNRPLYKTNVLNGYPAVWFDGSTDYLASAAALGAILSANGAGTVYAVARPSASAGHDQTIWSDSGATTYLSTLEATEELRAANNDGSADFAAKACNFGSWMIGLWEHNPDERTSETPTAVYAGVDDLAWTALAETASGSTTAAVLANVLDVGRGLGYFQGEMVELLFFPRAHSLSERRHVWGYLAEKYGLSFPDSEYEPVWVDVTGDVRCARGLRFRSGMDGPDVRDRVAGNGDLQLVLENSSENSAGVVGYYSPHNANLRSGFRVGAPVRVAFDYYGTRYYKWQGWIINLRTLPGVSMEREVVVRAGDWMDYASRVTLSGLTIQTGKQADQLMSTLYVNSPRVPESSCFNRGTDMYAYGLDNTEDEGVLILAEINRLTISELGYTYVRGDTVGGGQLRFEARAGRTNSVVRWALGPETELETRGLELSDHGLDGMINRVIIELHPRRVDAAATTVLFDMGTASSNATLVGATAVTFNAPYRDPANGHWARVGGTNMVTPVATTDYLLNSQPDGSGSNLTANFSVSAVFGGNAAKITVTKNSGADGYLTKCQLRGKGVYAFESVLVDIRDDASILKYGQMSQKIDMPYQSDVNLANTIAAQILTNNKEPRTKVRRVRFTANKSSTAMMNALAREIGDRISISESVSGLASEEYFIQAIEFNVLGGDIIQPSWLLVPADQEAY